MEYLALLITFASGVIGLWLQTEHKDDTTQVKRLTPAGWMLLLLIVASTVTSLAKQFSVAREVRFRHDRDSLEALTDSLRAQKQIDLLEHDLRAVRELKVSDSLGVLRQQADHREALTVASVHATSLKERLLLLEDANAQLRVSLAVAETAASRGRAVSQALALSQTVAKPRVELELIGDVFRDRPSVLDAHEYEQFLKVYRKENESSGVTSLPVGYLRHADREALFPEYEQRADTFVIGAIDASLRGVWQGSLWFRRTGEIVLLSFPQAAGDLDVEGKHRGRSSFAVERTDSSIIVVLESSDTVNAIHLAQALSRSSASFAIEYWSRPNSINGTVDDFPRRWARRVQQVRLKVPLGDNARVFYTSVLTPSEPRMVGARLVQLFVAASDPLLTTQ